MKILLFQVLMIISMCSFMNTHSEAQVADPVDVSAMAIYFARSSARNLPDNQVNYNITDPTLINQLLSGIEADTLRNCALLDAKNNAVVYVRFNDGSRQVYHIFLSWGHIAVVGNRRYCYYIDPSVRNLFEANAQ